MKNSFMPIIAPFALCLLVSQAIDAGNQTEKFAQKLVVTNTQDSGEGSLRNAVDKANACGKPTHIVFDIPKCDEHYNCETKQWEIQVEAPVAITGPNTFIDGYSQKGSKPNTNCPGQPSNACVKIAVVAGSVEAFVKRVSTLFAKHTGLPLEQAASKLRIIVEHFIAKNKAQKDKLVAAPRLLLPITGKATIRGLILD